MSVLNVKCYMRSELVDVSDAKLYEIRRFDMHVVDPPVSLYDKLILKIRDAYAGLLSPRGFRVYWIDDEGEEIGFSNDKEFFYASNYWRVISPQSTSMKIVVKNLKENDKKGHKWPLKKPEKTAVSKSKEDLSTRDG
jgi:hypothetical protein